MYSCGLWGQVAQEKRKETEKHLRDNIKWMMADVENWLKTLDEMMKRMDKVSYYLFPWGLPMFLPLVTLCEREAGPSRVFWP